MSRVEVPVDIFDSSKRCALTSNRTIVIAIEVVSRRRFRSDNRGHFGSKKYPREIDERIANRKDKTIFILCFFVGQVAIFFQSRLPVASA